MSEPVLVTRSPLDAIPDPDVIERRLDEIDRERIILRQFLKVARRRAQNREVNDRLRAGEVLHAS